MQAEYLLDRNWLFDGGMFHVSNKEQHRNANMYAFRSTYRFDDQQAPTAFPVLGPVPPLLSVVAN